MPERTLDAEDITVSERLIVAPRAGVFHPTYAGVSRASPEPVGAGEEIGTVVRTGEKHPVHSEFRGTLLGFLVLPGERVRAQQPVAWLRT